MLVLKPDIEEKDASKQDEVIKKVLGTTGMVITEKKILGKKSLAYQINKQSEGLYILLKLTGGGLKVGDLETQTKLNDSVMRYLLISQ
jgi:small subunit ribosomal protein S6